MSTASDFSPLVQAVDVFLTALDSVIGDFLEDGEEDCDCAHCEQPKEIEPEEAGGDAVVWKAEPSLPADYDIGFIHGYNHGRRDGARIGFDAGVDSALEEVDLNLSLFLDEGLQSVVEDTGEALEALLESL